MTKEMREIMDQLQELEARANGLSPLAETAEQTEIEARETEIAEIAEQRKALEEKKAALEAEERAAEKLNDNPKVGEEIPKENREENKMGKTIEFKNSPEYIDALARSIKTGDMTELRSILTENAVSGEVPIPDFAEERIRTAWESDEILNRVGKTYVKGNLKIGFEISGTDAVVHVEGDEAPAEEELHIGAVSLIPQSIKKWIESEAA